MVITSNTLIVAVENPHDPNLEETLLDIDFVHVSSQTTKTELQIADWWNAPGTPSLHAERLIRPMAAVHALKLDYPSVPMGKLYLDVRPHDITEVHPWNEADLETALAVIIASLRYPDLYDIDRVDKLFSSKIRFNGQLLKGDYDTLRDLLEGEFRRES